MAQKRIPVLEVFPWQPSVLAISSTPPGTPGYGDRYIIGAGATGAWLNNANKIATWAPGTEDPFWMFDTPAIGWETTNIADGKVYHFNGTVWSSRPATGDFIKANESSTDGKIPTWNGVTGDELNDGHTFRTILRPQTGPAGTFADNISIPSEKAVRDALEAHLAAADAMVFIGTINDTGVIASTKYPDANGKTFGSGAGGTKLTGYSAGWTLKASEAIPTSITGFTKALEAGDFVTAIGDESGGFDIADWTATQANIDGAVTGPASAVDGNVAVFDAESGKVIKDSEVNITDVQAAIGHIDILEGNPHNVLHSELTDVADNYTHAEIDTHIDTAAIHREMTYSASLKSIIYTE